MQTLWKQNAGGHTSRTGQATRWDDTCHNIHLRIKLQPCWQILLEGVLRTSCHATALNVQSLQMLERPHGCWQRTPAAKKNSDITIGCLACENNITSHGTLHLCYLK